MSRRYTPLTEDQRAERRDKERELVKQSVEALRSSEGWQAWLQSRSRFHKYSLGNQLLIAIQASQLEAEGLVEGMPVRVAGYKKWLELGYCVRKRPEDIDAGGWAIKIWAPCKPSKKQMLEAAEKGETARTFFRLAAVFGDNQVDPMPEPAKPVPLSPPIASVEGDSLASAWIPLLTVAKSIGSEVVIEDTGRAGGYYHLETKRIGISESASTNARVKTLVHELAHALVRADKQPEDPELNYAQEELVVESVALSVTGSLGLDVTGYSIPYLASYAESVDLDILEATAKLVNRLACRLEDALAVAT